MAFGNTVQAKVDLDISPFRRGLLSAQSELGKFSTKLSAGKVLGSIISGVGLGSGFAIAEKAAEMIAGAWERAAKAAEFVEASTAAELAGTEAIIRLRRTDAQNLAADKETEKRLRSEAITLSRSSTRRTLDARGRVVTRETPASDENVEQAKDKIIEANKLRVSIAEREKTAAEADQKKTAEARKKVYDADQKAEEDLADAENKAALAALTTEQKLVALRARSAYLIEQGDVKSRTEAAGIAIEIQQTENQAAQDKEEAARKIEDADNKRLAAAEKLRDLAKDEAKRIKDVVDAQKDLATALRDQSGATVGEVMSGDRGNSADRAALRRVGRLRRRAQRLRDGTGDYRTADGNMLSGREARDNYADVLSDQANKLQGSIGVLKSDEKDPLKNLKDALDSSEVLIDIRDLLLPVSSGADEDPSVS